MGIVSISIASTPAVAGQYSLEQQRHFLLERIVEPVGLTPGSRLLEIGCGMGIQGGLLFDLGFDVSGVDVSDVAIQHAKRNFPGPQFLCMNLEEANVWDAT